MDLNEDWLGPDEEDDRAFGIKNKPLRRRDFGIEERDMESGGQYAELVRGEAQVSFARWRLSGFDALIKLFLLGLYILMVALAIPPLISLIFDAVVSGLILFIFPFVLALFSGVIFVLSLIDSYGKGLSYTTEDDEGKPAIVSYRDRSYNVLMSGIGLFVNMLVGLIWIVWYAHHYDLNTNTEFTTFSRGVVQYYGLAAATFAIYSVVPLVAAQSVYANSRYQLGVHLADAIAQRKFKEKLEDIFK